MENKKCQTCLNNIALYNKSVNKRIELEEKIKQYEEALLNISTHDGWKSIFEVQEYALEVKEELENNPE